MYCSYRMVLFYIIGVDQVKIDVMIVLFLGNEEEQLIWFSNLFMLEYVQQFNVECREFKYKNGCFEISFQCIGKCKVEVLDFVVYGLVVKYFCWFDFEC